MRLFGKPHNDVRGSIKNLKNRDVQVRIDAAKALGELRNPQAVKPLIAALEDDDATYEDYGDPPYVDTYVRDSASDALAKIGGPAVEPLINALQNKEDIVKEVAANALGQIGDKRAVEPLLALLKQGGPGSREAAAKALGQIGDARAAESLIALLGDEIFYKESVFQALGCFDTPRAFEVLMAALADQDSKIRCYAVEALGKRGNTEAVEPLITALKDTWPIPQTAAAALGKIGDARAVAPLITAYRGGGAPVQRAVACALGQIGDPRAVELLIDAIRDDGDWLVQKAAATALGEICDPRAVEPLGSLLKHRNTDLVVAATNALVKIGGDQAAQLLNTIPSDIRSNIRRIA